MADKIEIPGIKNAIEEWQRFRKEVNESTQELLKNIKTAEKAAKSFGNVDSLRKLNEFLTKLNGTTNATKISTAGLSDAQKKLAQANRQLNVALSEEALAIQKARVETSKLNKNSRELATISSDLSTEYEKQSTRLNRLRRRQKDLATQQELGNKLTIKQSREYKKLTREINKLDSILKKVDASAGQFQRNLGNYPRLLGGINKSVISLARSAGLLGGSFLAFRVLKDAAKTVLEFDKQLIAVGKTTNKSGEDLKDLGKEIRDLGIATDGVSIQGLLSSAEVAGQLGISASKDILKFSKTIEQLKLTSDIVGEESVRNFAKFIEVSSDTVANADRLGSSITDLGNNFATTENQVLSNATEIQKGVAIYNTSADSILALGAATSSLGLQAEQARSGIQNTFLVLEEAANGGGALNDVLKLTGLTQAELSNQFRNDATGVFNLFVGGLSKIQEAGGSVTKQLKRLDLDNKQSINTLGSLSKRYDLLTDATNKASKAYKKNTALNKEVQAAAESLSSEIGDVADAWDDFILQLEDGSGLISTTFKQILEVTEGLIEGLKTLNETERERAKTFANKNAAKEYKNTQQDIRVEALLSQKTLNKVAEERADNIADEIERLKKLQKEKRQALLENKKDIDQNEKDESVFQKETNDSSSSNSARRDAFLELARVKKETSELTKENEKLNTSISEGDAFFITLNSRLKAAEDLQDDLSGTITKKTNEATREQIALTKEQIKARKQAAKDAFELARQRLKFLISTNQEITDNEEESLIKRFKANDEVSKFTKDLIQLEADFAISNAKGRADEITRISEDAENKRTLLAKDGEQKRDDIFQDGFENRVKEFEDQAEEFERELDKEAALLEKRLFDQGKSRKEIEEEVTEFIRKEREKQIKIQIDFLKDQLLLVATTAEQKKGILSEISALETELLNINNERNEESEEKRLERAKKIEEAFRKSFGAISDLVNAGFDRRISLIDEEIQLNEDNTKRQLDNFKGTDEEKKEIEEAGEARREQLEKKKRQEQTRQARFNKAMNLAQAIADTASAVAEALPNIPQSLLAGALGAAQIAIIASQPIPQYAKGKKKTDSYQGRMLWGEKQPEIKVSKSGEIEVATKPTIGFTEKGDTIYPSFTAFNREFPLVEKGSLANASIMASLAANNHKKDVFDNYLVLGNEINRGIKKGFKDVKIINHQPNTERFERISKKLNY